MCAYEESSQGGFSSAQMEARIQSRTLVRETTDPTPRSTYDNSPVTVYGESLCAS
jgi:hypothetical protein